VNDKGRYHSFMAIRSFSSQFEDSAANRSVDSEAPLPLRQEYIDVVYLLLERQTHGLNEADERRLYNVITQSLGFQPSGQPYSGFRYAISRDVNKADWQRFYDLIIRVAAENTTWFAQRVPQPRKSTAVELSNCMGTQRG
jgi:hypothetical protein